MYEDGYCAIIMGKNLPEAIESSTSQLAKENSKEYLSALSAIYLLLLSQYVEECYIIAHNHQ